MEGIHPRGEKGEVGSSVRGVDIGFIHGEEDGGMENIRGGRYGKELVCLKRKDEWVSFSLGMRRGKFGSPIVTGRWDYP